MRNYSAFGSAWILHTMRSRKMAGPGRCDITTAARIPGGMDLFYTVNQAGNLLLSRYRQAPGVQCILFSEERRLFMSILGIAVGQELSPLVKPPITQEQLHRYSDASG